MTSDFTDAFSELRQRCKDQKAEIEKLKKELAGAKAQRDYWRKNYDKLFGDLVPPFQGGER